MKTRSAILFGIGICGFGLGVEKTLERGSGSTGPPPFLEPEHDSEPGEESPATMVDLSAEESEVSPGAPPRSASADEKEQLEATSRYLFSMPEDNLGEVWAKLDAIDAELYRRTDPILRSAFENGFSEPVPFAAPGECALGNELMRELTNERGPLITATRDESGGKRRVVLERFDFPDLYVLKDASVRLAKLVSELQREQLAARWRTRTFGFVESR